MIIYKITNTITGKMYIGQTVQPINHRWLDHKSNSRNPEKYVTALYASMRKHGLENFIIEQIDTANTLEELNIKEQTYIKALNTLAPNGYNLELGGGNKQTHPETREKISRKLKGRPFKNRYTGGNKTPRTKEQKEHLSKLNKGKPNVALYKAIYVVETGQHFESINKAANYFKISRVTVSESLKSGKKTRQGYTFKLVNNTTC